MSRKEFENPVEQVMFILGFKHDPRFATSLEAMAAGSNPGITNAIEQVRVYGAIDANFCGMRAMIERINEHFDSNAPLSVKESVYGIIVEEMGEKQYGGKWFSTSEMPSEHWVNLGAYSPIFRREGTRTLFRRRSTDVFCLSAPYFRLLSDVFSR
jgi:hypothetical protein